MEENLEFTEKGKLPIENAPEKPGVVLDIINGKITFVSATVNITNFLANNRASEEMLSEYEQKLVRDGQILEVSYAVTNTKKQATVERNIFIHEHKETHDVKHEYKWGIKQIPIRCARGRIEGCTICKE